MTAAAATMPSLERLPTALLIDLDGTIADSSACLAGVLRQLPASAIEVQPGDFERFDGVSLPQIPEGLRSRYGIDEPLDELRPRPKKRSRQPTWPSSRRPARELVRAAHDAGVALALVTSAPRRLATGFLASSGLLASFAAVVAGEERAAEARPWPLPGGVAAGPGCARRGDRRGGLARRVASARGAGLRVVGVTSEPESAAALAEAGARPVLSDLRPLASAFAACTDLTP